jgi:nucleoside-diphosphate-sugar epimerase
MRIFVTGATGYIGQRLTETLLNQGHEIHALVRVIPNDQLFNHSRLKFYKGDLLDSIFH